MQFSERSSGVPKGGKRSEASELPRLEQPLIIGAPPITSPYPLLVAI